MGERALARSSCARMEWQCAERTRKNNPRKKRGTISHLYNFKVPRQLMVFLKIGNKIGRKNTIFLPIKRIKSGCADVATAILEIGLKLSQSLLGANGRI